MKKNVLLISDSVFPDSYGGSHRHLYELGKNLLANGFCVYIIVSKKEADQSDFEEYDGLKIYRFKRDKTNKIKGVYDFIYGPFYIYKQLRKEGIVFDVIHGHWPLVTYKVFKEASKKTRLIYTMHGPCFKEYEIELSADKIYNKIFLIFEKYIEQKVFDYADTIITASAFMSKCGKEIFGNEKKFNIIPVPTDTNKYRINYVDRNVARNELGIKEKTLVIFTVRRLVRRMGLDLLIDSIELLQHSKNNILLIVGGKGPYYSFINNKIIEKNLENKVKMVGFVPEEDLGRYYEAADFVVMPSLALEGFGLVTTEAMASGTSVIGTPVGANVEVIGKFCGDYVSNDVTPESFSECLLNAICDKDRFSREEIRSYVVKNYSWECLIDKYVNIYSKH